ncbi:MAG TPA: farnesyl diphosphate synthase [Gemmatimonadaceae bacterium]|nr:farnesyl diphosphate synthase [Gemmatimonadaceae bacterium]
MNDGRDTLATWREGIDRELAQLTLDEKTVSRPLRDAVHYSLVGEGKRLRGLLLLASYAGVGGRGDATALGVAIEVVHAYSLIHDDLPCMDNDTLRRGRPTTHRAFDVATATVAGVAMVPLAVQQTMKAAHALGLRDVVGHQLVTVLMQASGASGMVGGQLMDLHGEGRGLALQDLEQVHRAKTGALISAAFTLGAIAAEGTRGQVDALTAAGDCLGLAFQIADDVLDATASSDVLGKTAGADAALAKSTYASVMGIEPARRRSTELVAEAMSHLDRAGLRTVELETLAHFVHARQS